MTAPLAALTGSTGFLGRAIAAELAARGWNLRLLLRPGKTLPPLPTLFDAPEAVPGDLQDAAALARLVAGADVVIHCAGLVKALDRAGFFAVNEGGSAALGRAIAAHAQQAAVIAISSLAAREPSLSPYSASKAAGEAALAGALGRPCLALRPAAIYGPGDTEFAQVFDAVRLPLMPLPQPAPEARLCLIHVRDAAAATVAAAAALHKGTLPAAGRFELSDARQDGYAWREILGMAALAQGRQPPRLLPLPAPLLRLAGRSSEVLARLRGRPAIFGSGKAAEILHRDWSSNARRQLPPHLWRPQIDLTAGFAETVAARRR